MEEQLSALLGNPEMMRSIMSMAKSLGESVEAPPQLPIDPGMLQQLSRMAGGTSIDPKQKGLLQALRPYLNSRRLDKLEQAMRGARLASVALSALNTQSGR